MLLVHILSSPGAGTAHSDLMLMGIASGFAHRLNFETNGALNYSFIGEWTEFASTVVQRARPSEAGLAQHGEPIATEMKLSGADAQNDFNAQHLDEGQGFQEVCPAKPVQFPLRPWLFLFDRSTFKMTIDGNTWLIVSIAF